MTDIHVARGRLFTSNGIGVLMRRDELALLETGGNGAALVGGAAIGPQSHAEDTGAISQTRDGRLRVDTKPTDETVNLFAQPSPWGGDPWSSKSPW